jgi:hypothetical protein
LLIDSVAFTMASATFRNGKRKYNVVQALNKILADNSDDDSFQENDIDRDSCNGVSDHDNKEENGHADMVADTCAENAGPSGQGCISNVAAYERSDEDVEPDERSDEDVEPDEEAPVAVTADVVQYVIKLTRPILDTS